MARTRKYNIYYQDDYTQDADVLADNQAMAESIETALETVENKADNNTIEISNIKNGTSIDSFEDVETALSEKEDSSNKTGVLNSSSTTAQYPHAKAVYDELVERDEEINQLWNDHPDILDNNALPSGTDLTLNGTGDLKMKVDVWGNSTQETTTGKNWLDLSGFISKEVNGLTFSYQNGKLKINGTANALIDVYIGNSTWNANADTLKSILNAKNTTYYLSSTSNKISNYYWSTTNGYVENSVTTTDSNKISTIFVRIANGTTFNNELIGFQIEENSSATSWEKYTGGTASPNPTYKQDINNVEGNVVVKGSSKNLATNDTNITLGGNLGSVTIVDFGKDITFNNMVLSLFLKNAQCSGSGNTIDFQTNDGTHQYRQIAHFSITANTVLNGRYSYSTTNITFRKIILFTQNNSYAFWLQGKLNVLLEASSTPTDTFIPHAENTVTFPLASGQKLMLGDTLEDDGIHHKRGQYVFTGNENWILDTARTSSAKTFFYLQSAITLLGIKPITSSYQLGDLLLEKFIEVTQASSWNIGQVSMRVSDINLYFCTEPNTTLADFKEIIKNSVIEYSLATETTEAYTPAQQTAYNKLKEMQSYYDLTYVVGSSNNAQPILTVQAKKSLKVINDEISNINSRLTLLEE